MGFCKSFHLIGWLSKEMGLPSCIRTSPMTFFQEWHSTTNVLVKFGVVKIGALHIASLSCSKAWVASGVQENASFLVNDVIGAYILP